MDGRTLVFFMSEGMEWSRVALALFRLKKYAQANAWYLKLFTLKLELFGRSDFRTCSTMRDYGECLARGGALAEGKALIQEAIDHLALQQHAELRPAQDALRDVLELEGAYAPLSLLFRSTCVGPPSRPRAGRKSSLPTSNLR